MAHQFLSFFYAIEERFDLDEAQVWTGRWWKISLYAAIAYVVLIFAGQRWMRDRAPYSLRKPLVMWNAGLAAFSVLGSIALTPSLLKVLFTEGMGRSVCYSEAFHSPRMALWAQLFTLSKLVELGDTAFIVLRKTPLNFLHWYHHITVMIYTWYSFGDCAAISHWFGGMNYNVHSIMYGYYFLRASGWRLPSVCQQIVTWLQLTQMFVGIFVSSLAFYLTKNGVECRFHPDLFYTGMVMYVSYAILFMNFFYHRYIKVKKE